MIVPVAITVHVAFYTQTILDAESGALIHAPYLALTPTRSVRAGEEKKRGVRKCKRGHKKETRVGSSTTIRFADGHEATSWLTSKAADLVTDDRRVCVRCTGKIA